MPAHPVNDPQLLDVRKENVNLNSNHTALKLGLTAVSFNTATLDNNKNTPEF